MDWEWRWSEKANLNTYYKGLVERVVARIEPIRMKKKTFRWNKIGYKLCKLLASQKSAPHNSVYERVERAQCHKFLISITAHFKENVFRLYNETFNVFAILVGIYTSFGSFSLLHYTDLWWQNGDGCVLVCVRWARGGNAFFMTSQFDVRWCA